MSVTSEIYQRKKTGYFAPRECCPANGQATPTGPKSADLKENMMLPPSFKTLVVIDAALGYYEVPTYMINEAKGISYNSAQGAVAAISLQCMNDETTDIIYFVPNYIHICQPYRIYETGTTATEIYIWF